MKNKTLITIGALSLGLFAYLIYKSKSIINYTMTKIWDIVSEKRINTLHPAIRDDVRRFINEAYANGIKLRVTHGIRTFDEQNALYAIGRTVDVHKPTVTNARGGQSYHNYALAFDVVEIREGRAIWNAGNKWDQIGQLGKKYGFEWGGDWKYLDRPHFQKTFGHDIDALFAMHQNGETMNGFLNVV